MRHMHFSCLHMCLLRKSTCVHELACMVASVAPGSCRTGFVLDLLPQSCMKRCSAPAWAWQTEVHLGRLTKQPALIQATSLEGQGRQVPQACRRAHHRGAVVAKGVQVEHSLSMDLQRYLQALHDSVLVRQAQSGRGAY